MYQFVLGFLAITNCTQPNISMKEKEKSSLVDLGKRLLEASRKGHAEEVSMLMASGAPFTTDWVRQYCDYI